MHYKKIKTEDSNLKGDGKSSLLLEIGGLKAKYKEKENECRELRINYNKLTSQVNSISLAMQEKDIIIEANDEEIKKLEKEAVRYIEQLRLKSKV